MDPNSYEAYVAGQAGPDSPYRFGPTPSKYVKHLAKIAPVGRSGGAGGAARPATSLLNSAISPYDNPYTATTRPAASPLNSAVSPNENPYTATTRPATSPSIGAGTRDAAPSLATTGLAASPSNDVIARPGTPFTTAGPATSPSIEVETRSITPVLSAGSDSIPSSPPYSTSRSPSPDAAELISALADYESLSDDALYDAALNAQQAMVKWQDEYMVLKAEISRMRESPPNSKNKRKANPRKLEDPKEYDQKHHNSLQQLTPNIVQTTGNNPRNTTRPRTTNPINKAPSKGRGPRNELHIDMNEPMQPVEGKRIRKPRIIDNDEAAVTAPEKSTKRAREPEYNNTNAPVPNQPPTKKQGTRARSITPPAWVNTARNIKSEPSPAPENVPQKRGRPIKGVAKPTIKKEPKEETKGKDPVRAAAARLTWAKRQANGTNGRYGGAPKDGTVAKAKGK